MFYNLFSRYQPLPYGTHWMWPDVHWETPGPAFEQNTMLLLSDSMDRLLNPSIHSHWSCLAVQVWRNWLPLRCRCRLKKIVLNVLKIYEFNILFMWRLPYREYEVPIICIWFVTVTWLTGWDIIQVVGRVLMLGSTSTFTSELFISISIYLRFAIKEAQ